MPVIKSKWTKIQILKKRPDGYQVAKQPNWGQLRGIKIVAGEKDYFSFDDYIKNPVYGGTYSLEIASDINGSRIKDPQWLEVVQIPEGATEPIVHVDASNIMVPNDVLFICFRLIHMPPNENSGFYRSIWTNLTIVSQEKANKRKSVKIPVFPNEERET